MMISSLNKKTKIIGLAIFIISLFFFIVGISQKGICEEGKAKDSYDPPILELLLGGISGAICGVIINGAMHLTQVTTRYSISGHGRLPANIDGI